MQMEMVVHALLSMYKATEKGLNANCDMQRSRLSLHFLRRCNYIDNVGDERKGNQRRNSRSRLSIPTHHVTIM